MSIRDIDPVRDAASVAVIYDHYVLNSTATFEEVPVGAAAMVDRIAAVVDSGYPYIVFEKDSRVVGFAYACQWKARSAYRFSSETTVYLAPDAAGLGLGKALYAELLRRLREKGCRSAVACLALPNPASEALHSSFGFRFCGRIKEAGLKFDQWVDVGYYQLMLE